MQSYLTKFIGKSGQTGLAAVDQSILGQAPRIRFPHSVGLYLRFLRKKVTQVVNFIVNTMFKCTALLILMSRFALAVDSTQIAIFYPEANEPYHSIYQEIIAGSRSTNQLGLKEFLLQPDFDAQQIIEQLDSNNISQIIVLGRLGLDLAKSLPKRFNVVSGALPISPDGVSGISLISSPTHLFDYLKLVAPSIRKIHVAYSEESQWLIDLAIKAAQHKGFILDLKKVNNTKEALAFYQQLFNSPLTKEDSLWLPTDTISSNDRITLPLVLKEAWAREIVVFSSKPSHAKRGVLFSTYPDNFMLGKHLYSMIQELAQSPNQTKFSALDSLQLAVNLRTAAHLGISYSTEEKQNFKLTFPM